MQKPKPSLLHNSLPCHTEYVRVNVQSCLQHNSICGPVLLFQTEDSVHRMHADRFFLLPFCWTASRNFPAVEPIDKHQKLLCITIQRVILRRSPWKPACVICNYSWQQIPWVSPLSRQLGLAQSCNVWHPGHPASPTLSLCHRNATSSYHPPCSPEQHWSLPENENPFSWNYIAQVQL